MAMEWRFGPRVFPHAVTITGFLFALIVIWRDVVDLRMLKAGTADEDVMRPEWPFLLRGVYFIFWLLGIVVVTLILGQYVTLLLFVGAYLYVWGGFGWRIITTYVASSAAFLYLNEIVPVLWYESPFYSLFN